MNRYILPFIFFTYHYYYLLGLTQVSIYFIASTIIIIIPYNFLSSFINIIIISITNRIYGEVELYIIIISKVI